jgi:hypothetical protein
MFKTKEQAESFVTHLEVLMRAMTLSREQPFIDEIKRTLVDHICLLDNVIAPPDSTVVATDSSGQSGGQQILLCPDCAGEMAQRTNRTNGNKFWGCKKYPLCRGTRDENGLSKEEREAKRFTVENAVARAKQDSGFSFNRKSTPPESNPASTHVDVPKVFNPFAK